MIVFDCIWLLTQTFDCNLNYECNICLEDVQKPDDLVVISPTCGDQACFKCIVAHIKTILKTNHKAISKEGIPCFQLKHKRCQKKLNMARNRKRM